MVTATDRETHYAAIQRIGAFDSCDHFTHSDSMSGSRDPEATLGAPHGFKDGGLNKGLENLGQVGSRQVET